jgi:hypothetical protein
LTYLSPILPLVVIGTNGPVNGYGIRNGGNYLTQGGGMACSAGPNGVQSCYMTTVPIGKGFVAQPPQPSGTTIPSGLFTGWQYWQATITMQLVISLIALILSAILLPPIRHLPWRRRTRAAA